MEEGEKVSLLKNIINYLIYYNGCLYGDSEEILSEQIEKYIKLENFQCEDIYRFWENMRKNSEIDRLTELAIRLLNMPCREAAVERLFSHLKYLFGKKNYQTSEQLLNVELGIRMRNIYSKTDL